MMHDYMIKEIVKALIDNYAIRNDKKIIGRVTEALQKYGEDKIFTIWCAEDIVNCAAENGKKMSMKKAIAILDDIEDHFDASIGINWDVIREYV